MKKILIVSASDSFIERNSTLLRRSEFRIFSAVDSAQAVKIVKEQGADLILVDVHLNDMEGETFCELVRSEIGFGTLRIILVCKDEPEEYNRLRDCGVDALIAKPIKPLQLVKTVGQFLTIHMVRSRRVSLRVKVVSKKESVEFFCISHNISISGMLIETEYFLEVGSIIQCYFTVPGSIQVETEGEVVRTARAMDGAHQYGIQFTTLDRYYRKEIDKYISSIVRNEIPPETLLNR
ncbi:MAG TPA: response regulator [Geobacteraceae bacterium]|nr:response regulator [Geobacteraceae bacterium]